MKYLFFLTFITASYPASSQNWEEWTQQRKTSKKYLLEQVVALEVSLEFIQKGYRIVQEGAGIIQHWRQMDLKQHTRHFSMLEKLNPAIQLYFQKTTQVGYMASLFKQLNNLQVQIEGSIVVFPYEKRFHNKIIIDLRNRLQAWQTGFNDLINAEEGRLTDAQRWSQILNHQKEMLDLQIFCRQYLTDMTQLIKHRQHEITELKRLSRLYNQ